MATEEQRWEYCHLILSGVEYRDGEWLCDLGFFGSEGQPYVISEKEGKNARVWQCHPWPQAFGALGKEKWELVTVQHMLGIVDGGDASSFYDYAVAYFKRPLQPGREAEKTVTVDWYSRMHTG